MGGDRLKSFRKSQRALAVEEGGGGGGDLKIWSVR